MSTVCPERPAVRTDGPCVSANPTLISTANEEEKRKQTQVPMDSACTNHDKLAPAAGALRPLGAPESRQEKQAPRWFPSSWSVCRSGSCWNKGLRAWGCSSACKGRSLCTVTAQGRIRVTSEELGEELGGGLCRGPHRELRGPPLGVTSSECQ